MSLTAQQKTQGGMSMKKGNKSRQSKGSISHLVLATIKAKGLHDAEGKDASAILLPMVKKQFPASKFQLSHVYWYLGRYRRQLKAGKPVDRIVELPLVGKKPAKAAKKPATKKTKKIKTVEAKVKQQATDIVE